MSARAIPTRCCCPAGQRVGAAEGLLHDADAAEVLEREGHVIAGGPAGDRPPRGAVAEASGEHVREHRAALHQIELLEDHPDPPADPAKLGALRTRDVHAIEDHGARRRVDEPVDAA